MNRDTAPLREAAQSLFVELEAIVADPVFNRSPAQVRMLKYLVEASAAGEGASLKSYTIAVEGLGRSEDFDSQTNTYSRVLAARLRRSLDAFYHGPGEQREWRLEIPQGSYEVRLVPNRVRPTSPLCVEPPLDSQGRRRLIWVAAVTVGALFLAGLAYLYVDARADAERWRHINFPRVMIQTASTGGTAEAERMANVARAVTATLRQYESIRVAERTELDTPYILVLSPAGKRDREIRVELIDHQRNRRLYSGTVFLSGGPDPTLQERMALEQTIYGLFGFSGLVTSIETRNSFSADSPFDCWLRFSNSVVVDGGRVNDELRDCAGDWYEQSPSHPLAGAIYSWALATDTLRETPGVRRDEQLNEAMRIAERARALDPSSRLAAMSLARIYALMGDVESLRLIAAEVAQQGDLSPDLCSTLGLLLVLQNDPSGEAKLDRAIAFNPAPPPRYFVGKFIAAMMREDIRGADAALQRVLAGNRSSNWSLYLQTAYLARSGQTEAARRVWKSGTAKRPLVRMFPRYYLSKAPGAPVVKERLGQWMAPVIDR